MFLATASHLRGIRSQTLHRMPSLHVFVCLYAPSKLISPNGRIFPGYRYSRILIPLAGIVTSRFMLRFAFFTVLRGTKPVHLSASSFTSSQSFRFYFRSSLSPLFVGVIRCLGPDRPSLATTMNKFITINTSANGQSEQQVVHSIWGHSSTDLLKAPPLYARPVLVFPGHV